MMLKLNENSLSSVDQYTASSRMYASMCIFPHVDASVFCKIAKKYQLSAFTPGNGYDPTRNYVFEVRIELHSCSRAHTLNTSHRCWLTLMNGFVVRRRGHAIACDPCTKQFLRA